MRYDDWGARSPRWRGISSRTVAVSGVDVHYLHAAAGPEAPPDAPTQLLVHGMAASGSLWLDVIAPLTAHGPVVAPDLPGTMVGHTAAPIPAAARAQPNARFLRAFAAALGLDRVVTHGWSLGGLEALLLADLSPALVDRLVLVCPSLPGQMTRRQRLGWQTAGRLGLAAGAPLARGLVRFWGSRMVDLRLRYLTDPEKFTNGLAKLAGGDPHRLSPEYRALATAQTEELQDRPRQMSFAVTTFAEALSAMYVRRRRVLATIDRLRTPVLLLWGDDDQLIERPVIDGLVARRPDWRLHVFESAGHMAPLEFPDAYAEVVGGWLHSRQNLGQASARPGSDLGKTGIQDRQDRDRASRKPGQTVSAVTDDDGSELLERHVNPPPGYEPTFRSGTA